MNENESVRQCIFCGYCKIYKNGFVQGYQRYRCTSCKKTFSDSPRPVGGQRKSDEIISMAEYMRRYRKRKKLLNAIEQ
jgi:transposase-like protein